MEKSFFEERFKLVRKLDQGKFGDIYEVRDQEKGKERALKLEKLQSNHISSLALELSLYKQLANDDGFCRVYEAGQVDDYNYVIIDKLAFSLDQLFGMCGKRFTSPTVSRLAVQMITRLEGFHKTGYVHRDINTCNIMVAEQNGCRDLYLIDFGLAKPYLSNDKKHIQRMGGLNYVGTPKFSSVASHQGLEQSRKDDLESLAFMLVYFLRGCLPWQGIKQSTKLATIIKMGEIKKQTTVAELCKGLPSMTSGYSDEISEFLLAVRGLKFEEVPPYQAFRNIFLKRNPSIQKGHWDWEDKAAKQLKQLRELGSLEEPYQSQWGDD